MQLIPYWEKEGRIVIDINLKGEPHYINTKVAMTLASIEVMKHLQNLDGETRSSLVNMYRNALLRCSTDYILGPLEQLTRWVMDH